MTLREKVEALIGALPKGEDDSDSARALREAESMAEKYSEVKPIPYVIPMERFAGLPYFSK